MNAIIIDSKVYTPRMGHPDCIALCSMCDLNSYCNSTDREVCLAIASPTDHFKLDQSLTDRLLKICESDS